MTDHLTEDMLLKYQFELADENEVSRIASHLGQCDKCRAKLEGIKRKFSVLDVLGGEGDVPEGLIEKTILGRGGLGVGGGGRFRRPAWVAAAAVVMAGVVLFVFVSNLGRQGEVKQVASDAPVRSVGFDMQKSEALNEDVSFVAKDTDSDSSKMVSKLDAADERVSLGLSARARLAAKPKSSGVIVVDAGDIPDKAPFAPASAIELVVLPERESTQLTIYNSADLTLVREKRSLTLKRGWNWLQFMWANTLIDPTSLSLEPLAFKDKVEVELLSYPARLKDVGRWLVRSEVEGQVDFEITYLTSGVKWRAFYMGTLSEDARKMKLEGYVRVTNNSGEDYEDAETRLIVGKVNVMDKIADLAKRRYPYNSPVPVPTDKKDWLYSKEFGFINGDGDSISFGDDRGDYSYLRRRKEIKKEGLSEYFLYTIEGTETIRNKWSKRLPSFDVADIEVESLYKYDEERYGRGTVRFVSFVNDAEHEMGETPIPDGSVKVYRRLADGHLSYEGASNIKYIPVGEDVELNLGVASKVTVEPVLMDFATENYRFEDDRIVGWDEVRRWKLEVKNTTEIDAEIEITRRFRTASWEMDFDEAGVNYEMHDATHARFSLTMKPQSKRVFGYTVTTYHGTRASELYP